MTRHLLRLVGKTAVVIFAVGLVIGFFACLMLTSEANHSGHHGLNPRVAGTPALTRLVGRVTSTTAAAPPVVDGRGTSTPGPVTLPPPAERSVEPGPVSPNASTVIYNKGYKVTYGVGDNTQPAPPCTAYQATVFVWCSEPGA